jgi:dihydrofolate reductase
MPGEPRATRRVLSAFLHVSIDGYYCDAQGDMSFAHQQGSDPEWEEFAAENAKGGGALLFGRVTYDMMAAWWPTPAAAQAMPELAERMNALPKFVASRRLDAADWANTTVLRGDLLTSVRALKAEAGPDITILGSGSIVTQLADAKLLDEIQVVVNPIALGSGKSLFGGLEERLPLKLTRSRSFSNNSVALWYTLPYETEPDGDAARALPQDTS